MDQNRNSKKLTLMSLVIGRKLGVGFHPKYININYWVKCFGCGSLWLVASLPVFGENPDAKSPTAAIKAYLQDNPSVKTIIFRRRILSVPNIPGEAVPVSLTNDFRTYQAAQQKNAFYLREIRDLKDLNTIIDTNTFTADLLINGRSGERWWDVINTQITSWTETPDEESSPVRRKVEIAVNILDPVVHFGINNLKPHSLRWDGNYFTAQTTDGIDIEGNLSTLGNKPLSIEVKYSDGKMFGYICEYEYGKFKPDPSDLPSTILRYRVVKGVKTPVWVANILSFNTATEALPLAYFAPERFVDKQQAVEYIQTNRNEFKVISNVLLKLPGTDLLSDKSTLRSKSTRFAVIGSIVISAVVIVLALIRHSNINKQPMRHQ